MFVGRGDEVFVELLVVRELRCVFALEVVVVVVVAVVVFGG